MRKPTSVVKYTKYMGGVDRLEFVSPAVSPEPKDLSVASEAGASPAVPTGAQRLDCLQNLRWIPAVLGLSGGRRHLANKKHRSGETALREGDSSWRPRPGTLPIEAPTDGRQSPSFKALPRVLQEWSIKAHCDCLQGLPRPAGTVYCWLLLTVAHVGGVLHFSPLPPKSEK